MLPVPYIKPDYIPRTATTFTLRGFIESPVSTQRIAKQLLINNPMSTAVIIQHGASELRVSTIG